MLIPKGCHKTNRFIRGNKFNLRMVGWIPSLPSSRSIGHGIKSVPKFMQMSMLRSIMKRRLMKVTLSVW